jgi:signal transduction histidine kinase
VLHHDFPSSISKGYVMTAGSGSHSSHDPADVASLLRLLAEASDNRSFLATLCKALPRLLPATRVDLLVSGWSAGMWLPLAGSTDSAEPPTHAEQSAASFAAWLSERDYASISTLPLNGAGQHLGWLALARRSTPLDAEVLALAGQLAALIALRLLCDQLRDDLAVRNEQTVALERRLHEHEELRLRAMLAIGSAHDIGNLFASVLGHAQLLQQQAAQDLQRDLGTIVQAARDGHTLMRRMLALKAPTNLVSVGQPVSLSALVQDALNLTRPFWEARADLTIKTALGSILAVRAYAAELREVLVNLIMNAISAMPGGGTLTLRSFSIGDRAYVEVSDTGQGIAAEDQLLIFQPAISMRDEGGGYGLSVSRLIVEGYGGTLTVRSVPGQGATFTLDLPVARVHTSPSELRRVPLRSRALSR